MNDNYLWDRTGEPDPEIQKLEEVLGTLRYKNDNYLWARTGEPDPQIQKLEEVLGTLRYQARPLQIPADIRIHRKGNFSPLAIAAAIALFVIGAGLWFQFSRSQSSPALQSGGESQTKPSNAPNPPVSPKDEIAVSPGNNQLASAPKPKRNLIAVHKRRTTRNEPSRPALTAQELAEKEQVLVALRLASAKLNFAQRKVQSLPQRNIFRNQNKIG